jgi:hypothetical protein
MYYFTLYISYTHTQKRENFKLIESESMQVNDFLINLVYVLKNYVNWPHISLIIIYSCTGLNKKSKYRI